MPSLRDEAAARANERDEVASHPPPHRIVGWFERQGSRRVGPVACAIRTSAAVVVGSAALALLVSAPAITAAYEPLKGLVIESGEGAPIEAGFFVSPPSGVLPFEYEVRSSATVGRGRGVCARHGIRPMQDHRDPSSQREPLPPARRQLPILRWGRRHRRVGSGSRLDQDG